MWNEWTLYSIDADIKLYNYILPLTDEQNKNSFFLYELRVWNCEMDRQMSILQ